MAFVASLLIIMGFAARAADLAPIVSGGGYYNWSGYYAGGNLGGRSIFPPTQWGQHFRTPDHQRP
jgi:hypothetical protein